MVDYNPIYVPEKVENRGVGVEVIGLSALLMNNPASIELDNSQKKYIPTPEEEAMSKAYFLPGRQLGVPIWAFRNAIINASSRYKPKRGRVGLKSLMSHIILMPHPLDREALNLREDSDLIPLIDPEQKKYIIHYEIDRRRVVIGRSSIIRSRPRINNWGARFEIMFDEDILTTETLAYIIQDASQRLGVGDFRPQRGGPYGRFRLLDKGEEPFGRVS